MKLTTFYTFSAIYSCGTYGADAYDSNATCSTTTESNPTGGSQLVNTGSNIYLPMGGGILLLAAAVAIIAKTRKKHNKV